MGKVLSDSSVDGIFTFGKYHNRLLKEFSVEEEKMYKIPPKVDPKYFYEENYKKKSLRILYLGDVKHQKGFGVLLDALRILSEKNVSYKCVVVGEVKEKFETEKVKNIEMRGRVNRNKTREFYNKADIFVHPSLDEAGPTTLIESLACGTKCISTDRVSFREYDINDDCEFFDQGNPHSLANKILKVVDEGDTYVENPKSHVISKKDISNIAEKYRSIM